MKFLLMICFSLIGPAAFAASAGFLDEDQPTAKPAARPTVTAPSPATKQPTAAKKGDDADFKLCQKNEYTDDADDVLEMFKEILGVNRNALPFTVVENTQVFEGSTVKINAYKGKIGFQLTNPNLGTPMQGSGKLCKLDKSRIQMVTVVDGKPYQLTISKVSGTKIQITESTGAVNNTFTVR